MTLGEQQTEAAAKAALKLLAEDDPKRVPAALPPQVLP